MKAFLKKLGETHLKKKAATFSHEDINKFLDSAPDEQEKLALLFGLCGALRTEELLNLSWENIEKNPKCLSITLPSSKTDKNNSGFTFFAKANEEHKPRCPVRIFSGYKGKIKPPYQGRLFVQMKNNKYTSQKRGKNWFSGLPKRIAQFLKKPNEDQFTGHSIRRTAATFAAESGMPREMMKIFGRWKSDSVAEGYVDHSKINKDRFANSIQQIPPQEVSKSLNTSSPTTINTSIDKIPQLIIQNCTTVNNN